VGFAARPKNSKTLDLEKAPSELSFYMVSACHEKITKTRVVVTANAIVTASMAATKGRE
jgi:hypothetical protein